jgi:cell wall-associated NlpC family hydrolase
MITLPRQVWDSVRNRKSKRRSYEEDLKDWEQYLMEVTYQNYVDIIIEEARSWIGVPFHHQGRTKSGCDCIGIVLACARRLDYKYEDYTRYGRLPHKGLLEKVFNEHLVQIDIADIRPADGVLMTWKADPHHVAIITRMENTGNLG